MPNGINDLIAAQLSDLSYNELDRFQNGTNDPLPPDWSFMSRYSFVAGVDQLITFVNSSTRQVVMTFKGTDQPSTMYRSVTSAGAADWDQMQSTALSIFELIQADLVNDVDLPYQIFTNGHSLGGGLAQSFALTQGLSGYAQNSLPITQQLINRLVTTGVGIDAQIEQWSSAGNFFRITQVQGDPATMYFRDANAVGGRYLPGERRTLNSPYAQSEVAGAITLSSNLVAFDAWMAHSVKTVIFAQSLAPALAANWQHA